MLMSDTRAGRLRDQRVNYTLDDEAASRHAPPVRRVRPEPTSRPTTAPDARLPAAGVVPAPAPAGPYPAPCRRSTGVTRTAPGRCTSSTTSGGGERVHRQRPDLDHPDDGRHPAGDELITKKPENGIKTRRRRSSSRPASPARRSSARSTPRSGSRARSPLKLKNLKFGKHKVLRSRAIDASGNSRRRRPGQGRSGRIIKKR